MKKTLTTALLVLLSGSLSAEVYSWRDANGVIHYGDRPGVENAQIVDIQSARTDNTAVQERLAARQEARNASSSNYQEQQAQQQAAQEAADLSAEEKSAACEKARSQLRNYINARRLYRTDANGNKTYLKADEINSARSNAEKNVADKCR